MGRSTQDFLIAMMPASMIDKHRHMHNSLAVQINQSSTLSAKQQRLPYLSKPACKMAVSLSGFFNRILIWMIRRRSSPSERFSNLPTLRQARLGILEFLPRYRNHSIPSLTARHDDAQLVLRRRQEVVRLISQTDLYRTISAHLSLK